MVHEQMSEDLPSNKCPVSVGRSMLGLDTMGVTFCCSTFLFPCSKDSDTSFGIIAILVHFEITLMKRIQNKIGKTRMKENS